MEYQTGSTVFGSWTIGKLLGEGGYGKVYEISKEDFGIHVKSALKVMQIPKSQSEVRSALSDGMDADSVTTMYREIVEDLVKEIAILSSVKGHPNIVRYEDHRVEKQAEGIGWNILIRMELLTPLNDYLIKHPADEAETLRLGIELAGAVAYCEKKGLIHRDIKPENTFVDELGHFKLGDFGIARTTEKTTGTMSNKGTGPYMAPEVYLNRPYGKTVDIYSLGLMMYKLVNRGRLPFYPMDTKVLSYEDRQKALSRRIRGEQIPRPAQASDALAAVLLKACAYEPKDRYQNAEELIEALRNLEIRGRNAAYFSGKSQDIRRETNPEQSRVKEEETSPIGFDNGRRKADEKSSGEYAEGTDPIGADWKKEKQKYEEAQKKKAERERAAREQAAKEQKEKEQAAKAQAAKGQAQKAAANHQAAGAAAPQKKAAAPGAKAEKPKKVISPEVGKSWTVIVFLWDVLFICVATLSYGVKMINQFDKVTVSNMLECVFFSDTVNAQASAEKLALVKKSNLQNGFFLAVILISFILILCKQMIGCRMLQIISIICGLGGLIVANDDLKYLLYLNDLTKQPSEMSAGPWGVLFVLGSLACAVMGFLVPNYAKAWIAQKTAK